MLIKMYFLCYYFCGTLNDKNTVNNINYISLYLVQKRAEVKMAMEWVLKEL